MCTRLRLVMATRRPSHAVSTVAGFAGVRLIEIELGDEHAARLEAARSVSLLTSLAVLTDRAQPDSPPRLHPAAHFATFHGAGCTAMRDRGDPGGET